MSLAPAIVGLALSRDEMAAAFLGVVGFCGLLIIFLGWRKGKFLPALIISATAMILAFLSSPLVSEEALWMLGGAAMAICAGAFWIYRTSVWKTLFVTLGLGLAIFLLLISSPKTNVLTAEAFFLKGAVLLVALWLSWIFKIALLPTMTQKYKRPRVWIAAGVSALFIFVPAAAVWLEAVEIRALRKNPVVRTEAELIAQYERPWGARHRGIYVAGRIGDPAKRVDDASSITDWLAYYSLRPMGGVSSRPDSWFPSSFALELADGTKSSVQGILGVRQTYHWPEGGPRIWQRALRDGDPVVVWGEPVKSVAMGDGRPGYSIAHTKVIAYGSWEEFRDGYLAGAARTARFIGWIGFGCLFLPLLPLWWGYRHWRWLTIHGTDEAMPDNWKITIR